MITLLKNGKNMDVFIDSESSGLIGYTNRDLSNLNNLPFWQIEGIQNAYALTSDFYRLTDILRYTEINLEHLSTKNIQTVVIPIYRKAIKQYFQYSNKPVESMDINIILFQNDQIFMIDRWFVVNQVQSPVCLGEYTSLFEQSLRNIDQTLDTRLKMTYAYQDYAMYRNVQPRFVNHLVISNGVIKNEPFSLNSNPVI